MEIYLMRHAQTVVHGTYTGVTDVELSAVGENQAEKMGFVVNKLQPEICFCSPLKRCIKTHQLINCGVRTIIENDLKEIDFGAWEGFTFSMISEKDQQYLDLWLKHKEDFTFPGGDNIRAFSARVGSWIDTLRKSSYSKVLVITHGGVIRHALCHLLSLGIEHAEKFVVREASITELSVTEDYAILNSLNKLTV